MPFGFKHAGGDYTPRWKWNAQTGHAFRVDRIQNQEGDWVNDDVDITANLAFMVAPDSLMQGYRDMVNYAEIMVPISEELPAKPEGKDSKGKDLWTPQIQMLTKLSKDCGGDVREFSTGSFGVMDVLEKLVKAWQACPEAQNPAMVPVVQVIGTTPTKNNNNVTNYPPQFRLVGWAPRPADLERTKQPTPTAPTAAAPPPQQASAPVVTTPAAVSQASAPAPAPTEKKLDELAF